MTLTQMRYAVAIGDVGSFRLAAERCHVSQSGLSMQIQKLESLLDLVLFDRGKKPMLVTPEGESALAQMRVVLKEMERLGQVAAAQEDLAGPYRLGVIPTLSASVLPLFLGEFVQRHPQVALTIEELRTEDIIARLQADSLDAGIAATPLSVSGLREDVLGREAFFGYLPPGDPLLRKKSLAQQDLAGRELWVMPEGHCFRSQVLTYCRTKPSNDPTSLRFESGSFETLIRLVDEGLGATVLPALVVARLPGKRRSAQARPLVSPRPVREIGFVTARADLRRRVAEALVEVTRARLARALGPAPKKAVVLDPRP